MVPKWLTLAVLAAVPLTLAGCRNNRCFRKDDTRRPLGEPNPNALGAPLESIPPTGVPPTPGTSDFEPRDPVPPREVNYPPSGLRREPASPTDGILGDPIAPAERVGPKLLTPVPLPNTVPDRIESRPPADPPRKDLPPPLTEKPREKSPLELPEFVTVLDRGPVTASRKPVSDGFDWLKANGYKTLAYLHEPGATDVAVAKELAEKKGLRFVAIPVSPETLPAAYKAFAELVRDTANRPLHVSATSGNRAGSLWYLAFREVELLSPDAARVRAGKLGLQNADDSEEAKRFWLAMQEFLSIR